MNEIAEEMDKAGSLGSSLLLAERQSHLNRISLLSSQLKESSGLLSTLLEEQASCTQALMQFSNELERLQHANKADMVIQCLSLGHS